MKPTELDMIELKTPTLELPDMSYGYSNQPLKGTQIDPSTNREIVQGYYFGLYLQCTSGLGDPTQYRLRPDRLGLNKQVNQLRTSELFEGLATSYTHRTTLNYTSDFNYDYIMLVPPSGLLEVSGFVGRSTEQLQVNFTGSMTFVSGATFNITSTTETRFVLINNGTTHNKINLRYSDSGTGNPIFGVFMKLYF